jgi:hypothetical protein
MTVVEIVLTCENGKLKPFESVPGMGIEGITEHDRGDEFN